MPAWLWVRASLKRNSQRFRGQKGSSSHIRNAHVVVRCYCSSPPLSWTSGRTFVGLGLKGARGSSTPVRSPSFFPNDNRAGVCAARGEVWCLLQATYIQAAGLGAVRAIKAQVWAPGLHLISLPSNLCRYQFTLTVPTSSSSSLPNGLPALLPSGWESDSGVTGPYLAKINHYDNFTSLQALIDRDGNVI